MSIKLFMTLAIELCKWRKTLSVEEFNRLTTDPSWSWSSFSQVTIDHEICSLAWYRLQDNGLGYLLPQGTRHFLLGKTALQKAKAVRLAEAERVIQAIFDDARIPSLRFKGVDLARHLYGQPWLRHVVDVDIIIPESQWKAARKALEEHGYRATEAFPTHERRYSMNLIAPGGKVAVDLHWRMADDYFDFDERAIAQDLFANPSLKSVTELGPEILINLLAIHSARHPDLTLKHTSDVYALVTEFKPDWDKAFEVAARYRSLRSLRALLGAVKQLYGPETDNWPVPTVNPVLYWTVSGMTRSSQVWLPVAGKFLLADRRGRRVLWFFRRLGRFLLPPVHHNETLPRLPWYLAWGYPFYRIKREVSRWKARQAALRNDVSSLERPHA